MLLYAIPNREWRVWLTNIILQASTIASAGYTSTVESALGTLTTDTDALFAALEAKVDSADSASLVALQAEVDAALATASTTFQRFGGKIRDF